MKFINMENINSNMEILINMESAASSHYLSCINFIYFCRILRIIWLKYSSFSYNHSYKRIFKKRIKHANNNDRKNLKSGNNMRKNLLKI